jgi:hypothetical protein
MSPIIVLAGVGVIAAFLIAYFLGLVAQIKRVDRGGLENRRETSASRLLLTVRRPSSRESETGE